jgi:hypothetical protein
VDEFRSPIRAAVLDFADDGQFNQLIAQLTHFAYYIISVRRSVSLWKVHVLNRGLTRVVTPAATSIGIVLLTSRAPDAIGTPLSYAAPRHPHRGGDDASPMTPASVGSESSQSQL